MVIQIGVDEFESFIRQYKRLVLTICLTFTGNYFDAEDLAQETFLSAYRNLASFDGRNPKAWLAAIAANKCRDFLKSPARRVACLPAEELDCLEDERGSPEESAARRDTEERVGRLCQKLKEPYKTVAVAYFCNGIPLRELAGRSGVSEKTLQTRLYRSKKMLKLLWKEDFQ